MKISKVLGYLGLIPFIACLYLTGNTIIWGLSSQQIFIAYGAIILSFIAGTVWRKDVNTGHNKQQIMSNIFSLIAFIVLLIEYKIALMILAFSFIFLFTYEKSLSKQEQQPTDYMTMRLRLTLVVVLLHINAYLLWFD